MSSASYTLSEYDSRHLLSACGIAFAGQERILTAIEAGAAAVQMGFPVVVKLGGDSISHKTERGLVRLRVTSEADCVKAANELLNKATPQDGNVHLLVSAMVSGARELIAGVLVDPQFGPTVMLGVGGVLAEAIADVVFRPAPLQEGDAVAMIRQMRSQKLLGDFRGEAAVNNDELVKILTGLSDLACERHDILSVDVNPLIVQPDGSVLAVDGLVELGERQLPHSTRRTPFTSQQFLALFEPRGVLVAGASSHPGKFGFVSLHNILASGYAGAVFGTNLQGEEVLGITTVADIADLPDNCIDLVFVCTPAAANLELLRACASKGITAAFLTSAGYGEAGPDGRRAEAELVRVADELGILMAGPNGQGVVSTPVNLCAQIVAPYPPRGAISVASQSGNFVSSFLNYARQTGVGISRAVSAGNAASLGVADLLEFYASDAETKVSLAYVEGITDGRELMQRIGSTVRSKPVVLVKGGATQIGALAA
ncbi:MAG: hypothetical protein EXQ64_03320, partial [Ilumatobacteraceae bacterium]|nr:hypothetical protein [Ilumatobacteraceae bacterium]